MQPRHHLKLEMDVCVVVTSVFLDTSIIVCLECCISLQFELIYHKKQVIWFPLVFFQFFYEDPPVKADLEEKHSVAL